MLCDWIEIFRRLDLSGHFSQLIAKPDRRLQVYAICDLMARVRDDDKIVTFSPSFMFNRALLVLPDFNDFFFIFAG